MKRNTASYINGAVLLVLLLSFSLLNSCQKDFQSSDVASSVDESAVKADNLSGSVATDWYRLQMRILLERNSAFNGTFFSYIGMALWEAVRPGVKGGLTLYGKINTMPAMPAPEKNQGYSWVVSANAALASMMRAMLTGLTPANMASIDSLEAVYNTKGPDQHSAVFKRSQAFGRSIATAMYNWRLTDKLNTTNIGYIMPPPCAGCWEPTPPGFALPINPYVSQGPAFLTENETAISAPFPLTYDETPGSPFYNMEWQVYQQVLNNTPEQLATALHWFDLGNGNGYTPQGHDFLVVTQALEQTGADLATAAEAYAKAGIVERDGTIVTWRSKYANFLMRPVTYIQRFIDPNWNPVFPTPPHPEYPAAHAMLTGCVMEALADVIGNNHTIVDRAYTFKGIPPHIYSSVFAVAEEAGISRNYAGIHYLPSIKEGLRMAKIIGDGVGNIKMRE